VLKGDIVHLILLRQGSEFSYRMDDTTFPGHLPSLLWDMDPTQAGLALRHKLDSERIQKLEYRLQAYRLNLQNTQDKIQRLTAQFSEMLQEVSDVNPSQSPSDGIYDDLVKNQGCQYSLETLIWAQEIHVTSSTTLDLIRRSLPLSREPVVNSRFVRDRPIIAAALQDLDRIGELIQSWEKSLLSNVSDRSIVLAVDAIAFRPVVTIPEEGEIQGLRHLNRLDDETIFTRFL
jgi:hypothetical protein